jgi:hypothetical protein
MTLRTPWEAEFSRPIWQRSSRKEVVDAIPRVIGDMRQLIAKSDFGIDPVQPGRSDQPTHGSDAFATVVSAGKQVVASPQYDAAKGAFKGRVIDLDIYVTCSQY